MSTLERRIMAVQELQVRRKHHIKTATKLTNAGGALIRRGLGWQKEHPEAEKIVARAAGILGRFMRGEPTEDDLATVGEVASDMDVLHRQIKIAAEARGQIELGMRRAARTLPAYALVKDVRGLGELGFAVIVGEAGDLGKYATVDKLWKRLGLAPHKGHAMSSWLRKGLSSEDWTEAGYAPRRRAEVFAVVQEPLLRQQISKEGAKGPYGALYYARRARTAETHPDWTKGHSHGDAGRIVVKALVEDLWREWRRGAGPQAPVKAIAQLPFVAAEMAL